MSEEKPRHVLKDAIELLLLVVLVIVGSYVINLVIFRNFSVYGPSMEPTLQTNDRLIVNRLPLSWAYITGQTYRPERGEIVVFKNPNHIPGAQDEYIVKRVIGFPGERVTVKDGSVSVYPDGTHNSKQRLDPYAETDAPKTAVDGEVDEIVPDGEVFMIGDHHQGNYSLDSRNGLGTIPLKDIVGPVIIRLYPFNNFRTF